MTDSSDDLDDLKDKHLDDLSSEDSELSWREPFSQSPQAMELEHALTPSLVESPKGLKSTANTDVKTRRITLDISQSPIKCALSYAYELKNLENAEKFSTIIDLAKKKQISKADFIREIIRLEAEAVYFRREVFYQIGVHRGEFPCRQDYLDLYSLNRGQSEEAVIGLIASYIEDHGIVRREYAVKKYYADSYDFYAKKNHGLGIIMKNVHSLLCMLLIVSSKH